MKRQTKGYETPENAWQGDRIADEKVLMSRYGLKNKKEVWKAQSVVRDFRRQARELNAEQNETQEEELLQKLRELNMIDDDATLNDILDLTVEDVLERRLQTIIHRKGLTDTPRQARQLVSHGHVLIGDRKVNIPSHLVRTREEEQIRIAPASRHMVEA